MFFFSKNVLTFLVERVLWHTVRSEYENTRTHTAHTRLYLKVKKDKIREDNPSGAFVFTGFVVLRPGMSSILPGGEACFQSKS